MKLYYQFTSAYSQTKILY